MAARVVMAAARPIAVALLGCMLLAGCATTQIGAPRAPRDAEDAGRLVLPSGRSIPVYPAELRFSGRARFEWPDGRTYDGEWQFGLPHGSGEETLPDGSYYRGAWRAGQRHGLGELFSPVGGLYQGEFHEGMRQGKGVLFDDDGVYQGEWFADRQHGFGELAGAYGSHYAGGWRDGQRSGEGSYRGSDGSEYQGQWLEDRPEGFGIYRFPDGAVYQGEWRGGRQHGNGRLIAASGVTYEGQWQAAQRSGFGIEQRPDGGRYAGEWQADKRSGHGREDWPDGTFHDGSWELNRPMGPGHRRYYADVEIQGAWSGDAVSSGLLTLPSGRAYAGPLFGKVNRRVSPPFQAWLQAAASEGDPHAQLLAGLLYLDFQEPAPDLALARTWLERSASAVPEAAFRLGVLLLETPADRVSQDAMQWLNKAGDARHPGALRVVGDLYAAGRETGRDAARAIASYTAALAAGSPLAAERLARQLTESEDPAYRDPARAIEVLEWRALHEQAWLQLDTLARAHAAAGDPTAAARAQALAIESATPIPGAEPFWPQPRPTTPAPAASALIVPPPAPPDLEAMQQRLERYRRQIETDDGQSNTSKRKQQ